ncbi:MAG: UDP-N-acetylmuramate--L-alanine ligase, partial [Candidatus Omnitrophica bacterium]|nr:UDP-N-acetylmuramate--L-alanine ligase [Candidatus Omnitrophota bacterium]
MKDSKILTCHFIGIGGVGMSAIAQMANREGWVVSGSDSRESASLDVLRNSGIVIYVGHIPDQVKEADVVVYSSSISASNPELIRARKLKKRILHRAEMLALLTKDTIAFAVAGSHGKTTTTGLAAVALEFTSMHPTVLVGGNFASFGGNFKSGRDNVVVFEADESDQSFLHYSPDAILITNIDNDHLDTFGSLAGVKNAFCRFLDRLSPEGIWIGCYECEHTRDLLINHGREGIAYGFSDGCKYQAKNIESLGIDGSSFDVFSDGKRLGRVSVAAVGSHNILNALGACTLAY